MVLGGHPEVCIGGGAAESDGALDPSKIATVALIDKVIEHVASLFTSEWLHLGGDEVDLRSWENDTPRCGHTCWRRTLE